ncbi:MAG: DUF4423 domain-containing protein [Myxococcota bacterium]
MEPLTLDFEQLAQELLIVLRGRRSQTAWSRRLGYRSNVAYKWESGRRYPTAAETFRACQRTGIDTRGALARFYGNPPAWLAEHDLAEPETAALLLRDLQGNTPVTELAERLDASRSAVSRWLSGRTQPRLPDFLALVEAASLRVADFIAALVDPAALPSLRPLWRQLEARREGADRHPWTQAILRALELAQYQALPAHEPGWIAEHLGIPVEEEARCLAFLRESGQVQWTGTHYRGRALAVDTRRHPRSGRRLKAHWYREAARRASAGAPGQFSYNIFTCSRADLERIREEHLRYFQTLRAIVSESSPDEVVAVAGIQLFELTAYAPDEE